MFNEDGKREKGKNDELADEFFVCSEELQICFLMCLNGGKKYKAWV